MTITIHSTAEVGSVNGVPVRIWEGTTAKGVTVRAYIAQVVAPPEANVEEFEADLKVCEPGYPEFDGLPLRLIV